MMDEGDCCAPAELRRTAPIADIARISRRLLRGMLILSVLLQVNVLHRCCFSRFVNCLKHGAGDRHSYLRRGAGRKLVPPRRSSQPSRSVNSTSRPPFAAPNVLRTPLVPLMAFGVPGWFR